jgi:uncharacterized protein YndB with AHSA1/START domain
MSRSVDAASVTDSISLARVLQAPRDRVWREWTEPDRFADWFGGVEGEVRLSSVAMDVQVGGRWRAVMCTSEGNISWHGEYRELAEPERIVFTLSTQPPPNARYALVSVAFAEVGEGRTEMRFEQHSSLSPAQSSVARYGWARSFDRLAERLAAG